MASASPNRDRLPGINTRAIHHGESFAEETGTVMPPIFPSSTFIHGNPKGFDYTRSGNPNFRILESVLTSLEECEFSTVFGSGVSAITAVASTLQAGDIVLCEENLYGCTVRLFEKVFENFYKISLTSKHLNQLNIMENLSRNTPSGWMKSPEVALELGLTESQFRKYHDDIPHTQLNKRGIKLFKIEDVVRFKLKFNNPQD